ncbi:hypothetical protein CAL29_28135 [Bordetella genomosp. 10]|uniref:Uncharacterized protein n=1 Tax=Bordetella genomosp. 10 TaxID=1416804 RepID=A0A261S313_9BORD|nr:hypothetical protein [Bordetella genomosp. 10]OZI31744.1 hypothetical protein CAL29_28135 [Bordetella genomosp. 10]
MNVHTNKQHRDIHSVTVDEAEVHRLIAEVVAHKVGVNLDAASVTWHAYHSSRDTSTGIRHDVRVEIIDDHMPQAMPEAPGWV